MARPEEAFGRPGACAWLTHLDDAAVAAAPAAKEDLADAAALRTRDGGAGRLWRRRLARTLTARWLCVAPGALVFRREASGAARIVAPRPCWISAAARGPWSVVAVGPDPLGVDLELEGEDIAGLGRAWEAPPALALRRFTAAEAYAKTVGCSLDAALAAAAGLGQDETRLHAPGRPAASLAFQSFPGGMACLAAAQVT